mmetsp:Transcript_40304/g.108941  ORF Transcript_40304/g.108941 Transcript_40304/m.108941 type:complete len:257 (+) Transcript_40304:1127-1897(+)
MNALRRDTRPCRPAKVLGLLLVREVRRGVVANEHRVKDHAQGPHITFGGALLGLLTSLGLRRHELRGAALWGEANADFVGKAKVDQLHGRLCRRPGINLGFTPCEEKVLRLEVPVHDVTLMQVPDREEHLDEESANVLLREATVGDKNPLQDVPALTELQDQVHRLLLFEDFEDTDDVGVVQALQEFGLVQGQAAGALHAEIHILRPSALPVRRLDGPPRPRSSVGCAVDAAVPALAQGRGVHLIGCAEIPVTHCV